MEPLSCATRSSGIQNSGIIWRRRFLLPGMRSTILATLRTRALFASMLCDDFKNQMVTRYFCIRPSLTSSCVLNFGMFNHCWCQSRSANIQILPWTSRSTFVFLNLKTCLPNLLLPLGCTLSNDVRLWGFDGRAPSDSGFWANSDRHAYPDLMQSIRDAHPAFFAEKTPKGDEAQYVNKVHGDLLDERLTEAEGRGFEFRMLHASWTPTLQKRYRVLRADQA